MITINEVYTTRCKSFRERNIMESFRNKTPFEELPILFTLGSSSHTPEQKVDFETCDLTLWVKFLDNWFRPYGGFEQSQIEKMIEICKNDNQIVALIELLSNSKSVV